MTLASAAWRVWSCDASVVVIDGTTLSAARRLVEETTDEVDEACSRFRPDSELARLRGAFVDGAEASPLLAVLVRAALDAATWTDGDVDPTLGRLLADLGYDRDIGELPPASSPESAAGSIPNIEVVERRSPWRDVVLRGTHLTIPAGIELDLGATAKAVAADLAADRIFERLGTGALVSLGGDIATSGPAPEEGWQVLVRDLDDDPAQQVSLAGGAAVATSSTQKRRWLSGGDMRHHILDPRLGLPAEPVWKSVTVSADSCLRANALSTASIVRGLAAPGWLERQGISARFVDRADRIVTTGSWPAVELAGSTAKEATL